MWRRQAVLSTLQHAPGKERHFALVGLASDRWGQELSPIHLSSMIPIAIMITSSNSLAKGSGMPNHYAGDLLRTTAMYGLSGVRPGLFKLTVVRP
jgi:hypothetical protein